MLRTNLVRLCAALLLLSLSLGTRPASALTVNVIPITGQLLVGGAPVTGNYDLQFQLYTAATGGTTVGPLVTVTNVAVADGVFYAEVNFGALSLGNALYLQTSYRTAGSGTYTALTPRHTVPSVVYAAYTPYASFAGNTDTIAAHRVSTVNPTSGQALIYNGTQWTPTTLSGGGGFSLPYSGSASSSSALFSVTNTGSGGAVTGTNSGSGASGLLGGVETATGNNLPVGVFGNGGSGDVGVLGSSASSTGVYGYSTNGTAVQAVSTNGVGVYAVVYGNGNGIQSSANGSGTGLFAGSTSGTGVYGSNGTNNDFGFLGGTDPQYSAPAGVFGSDTGKGNGVFGYSSGGTGSGVAGVSDGGIGVLGNSTGSDGVQGNSANASHSGVSGVNTVAGGMGVYGINRSSGAYGTLGGQDTNGNAVGVIGSGSGYGVEGKNSNGNTGELGGSNVGVSGFNTTSGGYGVNGTSNTSDGSGYGVYGNNATSGAYGFLGGTDPKYSAPAGVFGTNTTSSGNGVFGLGTSSTGVAGVSTSGYGVYAISSSSDGVQGNSASSTHSGVAGLNSGGGNGVYGGSNTGYAVYGNATSGVGVYGNATTGNGVYAVASSASGTALFAHNSASGSQVSLGDQYGDGVYASAPAGKSAARFDGLLTVNGHASVQVLTIVGGSDVAEPYTVGASAGVQPKPGLVVSIDPNHAGQMTVSRGAYDHAVAGILSGAGGVQAGLTLRQAGTVADGTLPVACSGRVWCFCDADANGPIAPGDLLTTSDTPGHAMKAGDDHPLRGAILGKAMSSLKSGKGLVLVLVTLE